MLKPLVSKFRPDLSSRLKYIAEKQLNAKLKPIVDAWKVGWDRRCFGTFLSNYPIVTLLKCLSIVQSGRSLVRFS